MGFELTDGDLGAIWLTLKLAVLVTILLLLVSTPLAWWLANAAGRWKHTIGAVVALPLVLPPSVMGFYLLLALAPSGPIGQITQSLGLGGLVFTFAGLVVASMIYSLPFVVQPLQNAFESMGRRPLEAAATMGAGPIDRFFTVILPICRPGFLTAAVLGFTHTIGEFGVVLMIGGNIPDETRVISVQIYDHVEAMDYGQANGLALLMVIFSFLVLLTLYTLGASSRHSGGRKA